MDGRAHPFRVGSIDCVVLDDGRFTYDAATFFVTAPPGEVGAALAAHGVTTGRISTPYTCLLVDTGRHRVLVDTGGAGWDPGVGGLSRSLEAAGIRPEDVDVVVLTHGHPDHIGGTADPWGRPVFARARHVMAAAEWAFWTASDLAGRVPDRFREIAAANLAPIADRVDLVKGEEEIVPGVHALPSPGHTPGHLAIVVEDGGEELLYISDAALHPIHLEHPAWCPRFDVDPVLATATRRMLCERAVRRRSLVHAYHFDPYPCLGHVREHGDGWRWEPLPVPGPAPARRGDVTAVLRPA